MSMRGMAAHVPVLDLLMANTIGTCTTNNGAGLSSSRCHGTSAGQRHFGQEKVPSAQPPHHA